jgi:hypothetical protein
VKNEEPTVKVEIFVLKDDQPRKKTIHDKSESFRREYGVSITEQEPEPISLVDNKDIDKDPRYLSSAID